MLGCIQPISSPMMKRMFGFCCCSCAAAGTLAAVTATNDASKPLQNFLVILMARASTIRCPKRGRQPSAVFAPLMVCLLARYMLASRAGPTACARNTARILSPASGDLNCTKGKVGPYVSVGGQQHRRHGPCCGRIDGAWSATNAPSFLRNGHLDRFDQLTGLKGLAQKGNATGLERLLARGLVIEGGHEDDRKRGSGTLEPPPQFNTRHPAEMDVQEETIDLSFCSTIEEFLRRYKDHGRKALCVQQALGGIAHAGIVIHDCHDGPTLSHEMSRLPSDRKTKPGTDFRLYAHLWQNRRSVGPVLRGSASGHSARWSAQGICEM